MWLLLYLKRAKLGYLSSFDSGNTRPQGQQFNIWKAFDNLPPIILQLFRVAAAAAASSSLPAPYVTVEGTDTVRAVSSRRQLCHFYLKNLLATQQFGLFVSCLIA